MPIGLLLIATKCMSLIEEKTEIMNKEIGRIHSDKLTNINDQNVDKRRNGTSKNELNDCADSIFNLSSRTLSEIEKQVLNKGLRYGIRERKINEYELLARFEELAQTMNGFTIVENINEQQANLNTKQTFFRNLQQLSTEFIELSKKASDSLSDQEREALLNLSKDKSIII